MSSVLKHNLKYGTILLVIFGLLWGAFALIPWGALFSGVADAGISIDQEEKLGKVLVENVMEAGEGSQQLLHNPALDSAMNDINSRLLTSLGPTDYNYKIQVINNEEINAFTLPGGYIFINKGLISFCDSPEEVAAVLAHEIGHAEKRHVVDKLAKELGITILFSVLTGGDATLLHEVFKSATSTMFDREQEKEADAFSFPLMEKAHLNPQTMAVFFRKLTRKHGDAGEAMELLQTHPNNASRIKAALEYKAAQGFTAQNFKIDWKRVQQSVM
ncbi:MAG: M48 family metallopeptidase [Bacteroidota bacterium]